MKRTPLRPKSKKRAKADRGKDPIRQAVFARDGRCLLWDREVAGVCGGDPRTFHHLLKASQGGEYSEENGVCICAVHQSWIEDHPGIAHSWGLVVRAGETIMEAWDRMLMAGLTDQRPFDG